MRCEKTVYKVEEIKGPGLKIYHKRCFTCKECSRALTSSNLTDKDGEAFCKHCYGKLYGPKGFGFGNTLSTEVSTPKPDVEKEASTVTTATVLEPVKPAEPLEIDEKQKNGEEALAKVLGTDNCPTCTVSISNVRKLYILQRSLLVQRMQSITRHASSASIVARH